MSSTKSRLGKGLGALFPTLPGEDDLAAVAPQAEVETKSTLQENVNSAETESRVSRETVDNYDADSNSVSAKNSEKISQKAQHVSRETVMPSIKQAIAPHKDKNDANGNNGTNEEQYSHVSRETGDYLSTKHTRSIKRATVPSFNDVVRPMDLFFGDNVSKNQRKEENEAEDNSNRNSLNNTTNSEASAENADTTAEDQGLKPIKGGYLEYIKPLDIVPNSKQPRTVFDEEELRELAASIKEVGVLQPIVVRKINDEQETAHYELIMGERRWRASQLAGLEVVPAIVKTTADEDMLRDALLENLHRVALNPLEEAAAYAQMIDDFGLTQAQLSKSVSKSRPQIANMLRLLNLPASVQKHVSAGVLSSGHARALLGLDNPEEMESLAQRIITEGLSVRSTEEIVSMKNNEASGNQVRSRRQRNDRWAASPIRKKLETKFETKVSIKGSENHGRIEIVFSSPEDMNRIVDILIGQ
ncbi:ParB/RepB/Spo0J family partition protein [Gardnerella sp. 2492-Sm]|uniref:ParB/RepB/Spo0J family partition protein n=1 Tax=unclassified Gardnerella TaxID=2628112 RepID=UPI003D03F2BF